MYYCCTTIISINISSAGITKHGDANLRAWIAKPWAQFTNSAEQYPAR